MRSFIAAGRSGAACRLHTGKLRLGAYAAMQAAMTTTQPGTRSSRWSASRSRQKTD